jgi:hypothetical protein
MVILLGAGACSSSSKPLPKSDGGHDAVVRDGAVHDAATQDAIVQDGAAHDGDAGDARDAGGADGGCAPLDLTTNCLGGPTAECQPTWTAALAHPMCMGTPVNLFPITYEVHFDCGGVYHVRDVGHIDWGETYYYDIATGNLVALYDSAGLGKCFGAYQDARAACDTSATANSPVCTLYGGTFSDSPDAGLAGDAGAVCANSSGSPSVRLNAPCPRDGGSSSGTACYASCDRGLGLYKYVGCVSGDAGVTTCHASCSDCPR